MRQVRGSREILGVENHSLMLGVPNKGLGVEDRLEHFGWVYWGYHISGHRHTGVLETLKLPHASTGSLYSP